MENVLHVFCEPFDKLCHLDKMLSFFVPLVCVINILNILSLFAGTFMVVWKKEATLISAGSTKVIRDSRLTVVGTSLDIGKVTSKDSGNYTCEINTDVPSHVNIVLNVLGELFSRSNDARARYIFPFSSAKSGKLKQNSKLYTQRRSCINIRQSPTNIILNLPLRIM